MAPKSMDLVVVMDSVVLFWWDKKDEALRHVQASSMPVAVKQQAFHFPPYSYIMKAQSLLAVIAPALLPSKLESWDRVAVYNPKWVLTQFGYDHGTKFEFAGDSNFKLSGCRGESCVRGTIRFWPARRGYSIRGRGRLKFNCLTESSFSRSAWGTCIRLCRARRSPR